MMENCIGQILAFFGDWTSMLISLVALLISICVIWRDGRWRKLDRTFAHSPYRQPEFQKKREELAEIYLGLKMTQKDLEDFLNLGSDKKMNISISEKNVTIPIDEKINEQNKDLVVLVANLWGQMASEYNSGLLDKQKAKELLRTNFMKFCSVFEKWLCSGDRMGTYKHTIKLYDEWGKKDCCLKTHRHPRA